MSGNKGKESKSGSPVSKDARGLDESGRLDDSRIVNVDPDEERDLEVSLDMDQIRGDDEEEEKVDSDTEGVEHKGGPRTPGRSTKQRDSSRDPSNPPAEVKVAKEPTVSKTDAKPEATKPTAPSAANDATKTDPNAKADAKSSDIAGSANEPKVTEKAPTVKDSPATTARKEAGKAPEPAKPTAPKAEKPVKEKSESSWKPWQRKPKAATSTGTESAPASAPGSDVETEKTDKPAANTTDKPVDKPVEKGTAPPATSKPTEQPAPAPSDAPKPATAKPVAEAAPAKIQSATEKTVSLEKEKEKPSVAATTASAPATAPASTATEKAAHDKPATTKDAPAPAHESTGTSEAPKQAPRDEPKETAKPAAAPATTVPTSAPSAPSAPSAAPVDTPAQAAAAPSSAEKAAPRQEPTKNEPVKEQVQKTSAESEPSTAEQKEKEPTRPVSHSTHTEPTHPTQSTNPKSHKTTKNPPRDTEEDHKAHAEEAPVRTFKFKRNRQEAEVTGNQGGKTVSVLPPHELSLKMQAAWRGKLARRKLRVQQIAAVAIQTIYRGNKERERSSAQIKRHREKIQAEQTRKTRLAHIRSKEKDLALLATIPPDQYLDFERLRRANGAKAIQRNFRAMQQYRSDARQAAAEANLDDWLNDDVLLGTRAHTATTDARRYPRAFTARTGKAALTGHASSAGTGAGGRGRGGAGGIPGASSSLLGSTPASEERALREQSDKLRAHMVKSISDSLAERKKEELFAHFRSQTPGTKPTSSSSTSNTSSTPLSSHHWKPYEVEVEALALAQLQRKIREAAHTRTRQADARSTRSGFRPAAGAYKGSSGDVNLSYDANSTAYGAGSGGSAGQGGAQGGAPRWGARRNYQDLVEAQTHANILLQEHQYVMPHLEERQRIRHKALGNCQHLLEQLQKPLSLEQARSFIAEQKNSSKKGEIGSKGGPSDPHAAAWLVDEDLWSADKVSGSSSGGVSGVSGSGDLYVHPAAVQAAAEQHVHALYALRTSSIAPTNTTTNNTTSTTTSANTTKKHWGAVALPLPLHVVTSTAPTTDTTTPSASLRGSGDWKDLRNSFNRSFDADTTTNTASNAHKGGTSGASEAVVGGLSQRLLTDAKLFRPLASQWAKGSDVEDSLYWIAYATQPSNVTPHAVDPSPLAVPGDEAGGGAERPVPTPTSSAPSAAQQTQYDELRRRIAVEAMGLSQRVPRVQRQVLHEQERISRLAEVYQAEMFAYLRREHALSAQQLLGGERAQLQHTAACRIQAVARGRSSRIHTTAMRAQHRVYLALQNLFHEIALSEGAPPPPLPTPHYGHPLGGAQGGAQGGVQQSVRVAQAQAKSNMFNSLLSSLAPNHPANTNANYASTSAYRGVGSGHSAVSRNSSTLAGLNITSTTHNTHPMGGTHLSALTNTPGGYATTNPNTHNHTDLRSVGTTPSRYGSAVPNTHNAQYPLQSVLPPANKQYTATTNTNNIHTDPRALVSNVTHKHVNVHGQTPSYFSPMVSGNHSPSRGIDAHYKDYTTDKYLNNESKGEYKYDPYGGIAGTPGTGGVSSGGAVGSVVNRGAWSSGAQSGAKKGAGGSGVDSRTGAAILGTSSPSRQTFNVLNSSFTAGDQVPEESLMLSQSIGSVGLGGSAVGTPHSARGAGGGGGSARGGAGGAGAGGGSSVRRNAPHTGPFSPKASVSFSLEVPADHNIPSGRQLQRSIETPLVSSPLRHTGVSDTPGSAASHLSEFSYMHDDDAHPHAAYISSPGHSQHSPHGTSLSRSLSASFGQVSGNLGDDLDLGEEKEGRNVRQRSDKHSPRRADKLHSPKRPVSAGGHGGLSPALLAKYGAHHDSSDDSVEGLEIPYQGGRAADNLGPSSIRGFRVHGTAQAGRIAASAAVAVGQAMGVVEGRFRSNTCTVKGFTTSAMAADARNFDKAAALRLLQSMAMVTGVSPLIEWLQRFRYDPQQAQMSGPDYVPGGAGGGVHASPNTSLVLSVGEISVQDCALLIAELTAELHLLDTSSAPLGQAQKSAAEAEKEMMYNLIQTCVLLKLLGAASDTGRLRLSELSALLEDAWVLAVPINGVKVSLLLAQLRFSLLQHATRKACHPRKSFDDLLAHSKVPLLPPPPLPKSSSRAPTPHDEEPYISSASAGRLFELIFATSAQFSALGGDKTLCAELAQAVVRFAAWRDDGDVIAVHELRSFVCSLCSFRSLQKRIQTWFRAVPGMHQTLLKEVAAILNRDPHSQGMVSNAAFCRACDASGLPLSHAECFMLGQLLTRRRVPAAGAAGSAEGGPSNAFVDVALLQRIKVGDFLQAAL